MSGTRRRLVGAVAAAVAAVFFALWIVGLGRYTSLGIDRETVGPACTVEHYHRVRWPGDGSFWIGGGHACRATTAPHAIDAFDLGGTFFRPPRRPEPITAWNRVGFWRQRIDNATAGHVEWWIGVPGWLPALLLGLLAAGLLRHARSTDVASAR